jgi:hypothetical protein
MITLPLIAYMVMLLLAAAIGFAVGWEGAVHHYREARKKLVASIESLEVEVNNLNTRLSEDPLRAAMSHGQTYVLNQIEVLIHKLRESIP